jgi:hypothetical protein
MQIISLIFFLPLFNNPLRGLDEDLEGFEPAYTFLKNRYQPVDAPYLFDGTPEAIQALMRLPDELLPRLPEGYLWARTPYGLQLKKYVFATPQPDYQADIQVVIYGPDTQGNINYLTLLNGVNYQGFINMRPEGDSFRDTETSNGTKRRYPFAVDAFDVPIATVKDWETWGNRWGKGHIIPFCATMEVGKIRLNGERVDRMFIPPELRHLPNGRYYSTHDKRNYLPEPPVWNERYRRTVEGRFRANDRCFLQYPYYDENYYRFDGTRYMYDFPRMTANETRIPEGVILAEVIKPSRQYPAYSIGSIYDVHWESVLPQNFDVNELLKRTSDRDRFLPYPVVSQFDRGIRATKDYVDNLAPKIVNSFGHRIGSYTALSKVLHLRSSAASHQFTRPAYSLEQAFGFSGEHELNREKVRHSLVKGWELATFLDRELGGTHEILSQREMEDLEYSYRNEELGFEDIYSSEIDAWRQIYRNREN